MQTLTETTLNMRIEQQPEGKVSLLGDLSHKQTVLLLFLRHKGCTFCRETVEVVAQQQKRLEEQDILPVFVHMSEPDVAVHFFRKAGLQRFGHVSDPKKHYYRSFDLKRGTLRQLFGPRVWLRGFQAGILKGHGVGTLDGDGFQMPGHFLISKGQVIEEHRARDAADLVPLDQWLNLAL